MLFKKSIYLPIAIWLMGCATAQVAQFNPEEHAIRIVENLDGTKDQLFVQSNRWLVNSFRSAKDVVQFADKESGTIMGKYNLYYRLPEYYRDALIKSEISADAIIEINVKDGKSKIEVKPLSGWKYFVNSSSQSGISSSEPKKFVYENGEMKEVIPTSASTVSNSQSYGYDKAAALRDINRLADEFESEIKKQKKEF